MSPTRSRTLGGQHVIALLTYLQSRGLNLTHAAHIVRALINRKV